MFRKMLAPNDTRDEGSHSRLPVFFRGLMIALITLAAYLPVFNAGYIWDDTVMLTENPFVKSADGLPGIWSGKTVDYLPATLTMLWVEWRFFGMNPAGYHIVNVLLHAFGAVLLWRVLLRLKIPGAWLGALLFAVHPVCVASVAWISECKNTLSLVFFLLSILFYLRFDQSRNPLRDSGLRPKSHFYWLSLVTFFLGLLSKSSIVILPVVLLLCLWWQNHRITRADFLRTIPFFAASLLISAVTIWFQNTRSIGDTPFAADPLLIRVIAGSWAGWFYLWKTILPLELSMIYPRWVIDPASVTSYLPGVAWLALLFSLWHLGRARHSVRAASRALFFALAYAWITLWPVLGLFDMYFLNYSQVADHWQYLSVIGICALLGSVFCRAVVPNRQLGRARRSARAASNCRPLFFTLIPLALGILTWQRAQVFVSQESLWRDTLKKNPGAWVAHNNLGNALEERGEFVEAEKHHAEALRLQPHSPDTHYNIAKHLARSGETEKAIVHYREALRLAPRYTKAHNNLGIILESKGQTDEALAHYSEAVRFSPGYAVAQNNLAQVLLKKGEIAEALAHGLAAVRLHPDFPEAHYNVANAFSFQRNAPESARHFQKALRLRPDYPEAHYNLGNLLAAQGKIEDARQHFIEAVRLRPNFADAQNNLGNTFAAQGKWAEASSCYAEVLRIDPAHPIAQSSLGFALFRQNRLSEAAAQLSAALQKNPSSSDDHFNLANVDSRLGKNDSAKTHYTAAIKLRPNFAEAHFQLALVFMGEHNNAEAVEQLRAAVKLRPKWGEALNNLAWILATAREPKLRNGTEAMDLARRAVEISGGNSGTLDTLAAAQAEVQQFADAVTTATKAAELAEKSGQKKLADEIRSRLQLYQSAQPHRE